MEVVNWKAIPEGFSSTHGIANKGFRGMQRLSLASNSVYLDRLSLRYPLLAIPSTVIFKPKCA